MINKWWKEADKAACIFETVKALELDDIGRKERLLSYSKVYSNNMVTSLQPFGSTKTVESIISDNDSRIRINAITSAIDTLVSKISKNTPKISFLPIAGDDITAQKVNNLEKFISGIFDFATVYNKGSIMFLEGCIGGTGALLPYNDNGNIAVERVPIHEIQIDNMESMYGEPRSMYRTKTVSKDALIEQYPEHEIGISGSALINLNLQFSVSTKDLVSIHEAWHLPDAKGKNGLHVICTNQVILVEEPYEYDDFPFIFYRYKDPQFGFWGSGAITDVIGLQLELNDITQRIQEAQYLCSNPVWFVHTGTTISSDHLGNLPGIHVPYTGTKPDLVVSATVHPELYQRESMLINTIYQMLGVSQSSAQSKNELGPNASGAAFRELENIESERFGLILTNYYNVFKDLARKIIRICRLIYKDNPDFSVKTRGKKFLEKIEWKSVDLDDDSFDIRISTSSNLPDSKAGKTQTTLDWLNAGLISPETGRDLLDVPDIDMEAELERAPREYIREIVNRIAYKGEEIEPEKYDNLPFALKYTLLFINRAKINNLPEDRLMALRRFIDKVEFKIKQVEQEAALRQQQQAMQAPQQPLPNPAQMAPAMPGETIPPQ